MAIKAGAILKAGLHPGSVVTMALTVPIRSTGHMNIIITGMAHSGAGSKAGVTNGLRPGYTGRCSSHGEDEGHLGPAARSVLVDHSGLAARSALVLRGASSGAAI